MKLQKRIQTIVIMACGFDATRSASEYATTLARSEEWNTLRAVKNDCIFAMDADKPSHRIVTGIEILSKIIINKSRCLQKNLQL